MNRLTIEQTRECISVQYDRAHSTWELRSITVSNRTHAWAFKRSGHTYSHPKPPRTKVLEELANAARKSSSSLSVRRCEPSSLERWFLRAGEKACEEMYYG